MKLMEDPELRQKITGEQRHAPVEAQNSDGAKP